MSKNEDEVKSLKAQLKKSNEQFSNLTNFLICDLNFGGGYTQRIADDELTKQEKKLRYEVVVRTS